MLTSQPNPLDFRVSVRRLLMVPVAVLFVLGSILGLSVARLVGSARWIDHTDQVIGTSYDLQKLILDEETGLRGFLLTGDASARVPFDTSHVLVEQQFAALSDLVKDNPAQEQKLSEIHKQHRKWLQQAQEDIAQQIPTSRTARLIARKRQMDAIRANINAFIERELRLRESRSHQNARELRLLIWVLAPIAVLLAASLAYWLFRRLEDLKQRDAEQTEALSEERRWLQTTLRAIGDAVIATDAEGTIVFMNAFAEACTGWKEEEARGRPLVEVFRILNELTRATVESPVDKVRRTGAVCGLANHTILIRKDGSEIHIDDSGAPIRNARGEIAGIVLVFRNIEERRAAEKQREESEKSWITFTNALPTLAWMADAEGWIFWYNQRWYDYTGTTPKEMEGWGWQSVHDPAALPDVMEKWTASIRTGEPFEMVFPLRGADGKMRSFLTRVVPLRDSEGRITRWFGTNTDVDELERTKAVLASEQQRLAALIDHLPLGLVFADKNGAITGGNLQVERILRHPVLLSSGVEEYGRWVSYHADGTLVRGDEYPLAKTLQDGGMHSGEYLYQRGDGTKAWLQFVTAPIRDSGGTMNGAIAATLDIDERKRVEEDLREKGELIHLAQTAVNAGYWSYYPASGECFLSLGEQVLFGLQENARPKISEVLDRVHPADRDDVIRALEEGMVSGTYFAEFRVQRDDGAMRWLAGRGRVLTRADGEQYMVGINIDVTNQKITEEALRKSEKLAVAGRLAATIAHEINNPLESVTNLLYLLRTTTTDDQAREYATTAEEELNRASRIVTQSLRFHRQSTLPTLEKLSSIADSAASMYKNRLAADHVQIQPDYRDSHFVRCYASELRQVFGNFIGNALDAISQGGTIYIRTRDAFNSQTGEAGVRVSIADTGAGMNQETIQRIFEPFFTTKGIQGTGLGLWISKDLLKKHHATLRVRSCQGPRLHGTVFSVFFPLLAVEEPLPASVTLIRA